jgi:subtilisin family serine protease
MAFTAPIPPPPPAIVVVPAPKRTSGDPLRVDQPHLTSVGWTPPTASPGAVPLVAVLDTGVAGDTPDLQRVLDTRFARSFAPGSRDPLIDAEGHGTHVAGIIAASSDNGVGISGVSAARILSVKIADSTGQVTTSALVRGIRYAVARKARVINISIEGGGFSRLEQDAIDDAVGRGALVVVAAGNSGARGNRPEFPGAYQHVLAVSATNDAGVPLASSTQGPQVALAAPGENILSTLPGGAYGRLSGSSMAAAVVSGVAARVWAARPDLDRSQIEALLVASAHDVGAPGIDIATGAGVVDLPAALTAPAPTVDPAEPNNDPRRAARQPPLAGGVGPVATSAVGRVVVGRDPRDDYRVRLAEGDHLTLTLTAPPGTTADLDLKLWRPRTPGFRTGSAFARLWLAAASLGRTSNETLEIVAQFPGVYTVEVGAARGGTDYRLRARREPAAAVPEPPPA